MLRNVIVSGMLTMGLLFIGVRHVGAQLEFGSPERLGPNINDDGDFEIGPNLSHDGRELFFVVGPDRTLYSARRETTESDFGPRQKIRGGGSPSVSSDGRSLYFFADGDLWVMTRDTIDADWGHAEDLGQTVNSQYHDGAPSISADERELYFATDRPGGGVVDLSNHSIWVAKRDAVDSQWEEPVPIGLTGRSPSISADGLQLFYSCWFPADGFGDIDLCVVKRESIDSDWGEPVNLGPEVNTAQSEITPHLSADGSELYFSRGDTMDNSTYDLWRVPVILPPAADALQAGDADQNYSFDQLDLVRVLQAGKYLTGEPATWGEGDWNGAPGGSVGDPPAGDGLFDQLDIIKALASGLYMTGPSAAVRPGVETGDAQTWVGYDAKTGELAVDTPAQAELTSINIDSATGIFTGQPAANLGGSFDNDSDTNVFKAAFGGSFVSLSFGNVAQPGLGEEFLLGDLSVAGSLAGGGDRGDVDWVYVPVPEPASILLLSLGVLALACTCRRLSGRRPF